MITGEILRIGGYSISGGDIIKQVIEFLIILGGVLLSVFKLLPKLRIENKFKKALEKYKGEYQKSVRNFDLYRSKKHEVYNKITKLLYQSGLCTWGLSKYVFSQMNTYEGFSNDEIKEKVIKEWKGLNISQNDLDELFKIRIKYKDKFVHELMRWKDISDINILRNAYSEFDDYILSNQLYIKEDIFKKLKDLSSEINKLLVTYKCNEEGLYERSHKDFIDTREKLVKSIREGIDLIVENMRKDIENYGEDT